MTKIIYLSFLFLIIIFLPSFFLVSFGDNSTPLNTSASFNDIKDSSFVSWSITLVSINGNYTCPFVCPNFSQINFTNIAQTVNTNPSQSFGVQIQIGNTSITGIDSNNVYFNVEAKNVSNPNLFYYFLSFNVPPQVTANSVTIPQTSYLANQALYNACTAPCVYQATSFLEIKALASVVTPVIVCTLAPCLTIEPAGSTDLLLIIFALVLAVIMMIIALKFNNPFPALVAALVMLVMYLGINSNPTIVYGTNQIALPVWFTEVFVLFIVVAFVYTFYLIFKWRHR